MGKEVLTITNNYSDVKKFIFEFENDESVEIDSKYVESFALFDVAYNVEKKYGEPEIETYASITRFHFMINKDADLPLNDGTTRTVAQRLSYEDVSKISVVYTNEMIDSFYIPWDDDDENSDKWQLYEDFDDLFVIRR